MAFEGCGEICQNELGYFGAEPTYKIGDAMTFTIDSNKLINFASDDDVKYAIAKDLNKFGTVVSLDRPLFSQHYILVFTPSVKLNKQSWTNVIVTSFAKAGFDDAKLVAIEGGTTSSDPGGIQGAVKSGVKEVVTAVKTVTGGAGDIVSSSASSILDPIKGQIVNILLIGGIAAISWIFVIKPGMTGAFDKKIREVAER